MWFFIWFVLKIKIKFSWQCHRVTHALFLNVKWKIRGRARGHCGFTRTYIRFNTQLMATTDVTLVYQFSRCQVRARNRESRSRKMEWGSQISHVRSWRPPTRLVGELFHRYWRFLTVLFSLPILSSWWLKSPFDHFLTTNLSCQYENSRKYAKEAAWASWAFLACGVLFSWGRRWWRRACFSLQGGALVLFSRVSRVVFCRFFTDRSDFRAMKSYYMAATSASRPPDLPGVFYSGKKRLRFCSRSCMLSIFLTDLLDSLCSLIAWFKSVWNHSWCLVLCGT